MNPTVLQLFAYRTTTLVLILSSFKVMMVTHCVGEMKGRKRENVRTPPTDFQQISTHGFHIPSFQTPPASCPESGIKIITKLYKPFSVKSDRISWYNVISAEDRTSWVAFALNMCCFNHAFVTTPATSAAYACISVLSISHPSTRHVILGIGSCSTGGEPNQDRGSMGSMESCDLPGVYF